MPIVGERKKIQPGKGYEHDKMHAYAEAFAQTAKAIVTEAACDMYADPKRTFISREAKEVMKNFFMENAIDSAYYDKTHDPEGLEAQLEELENLYENDMEAVNEYAAAVDFNPVVGLTFPIHKYIMMNCMFDKAIPHAVAASPRFTITIESRIAIDSEGNEIDMFREQSKMYTAMKNVNPAKETEVTLPEFEKVNLLETAHGLIGTGDNLSIETKISAVKISKMTLLPGDIDPETGAAVEVETEKTDVWLPHDGVFTPGYGEYDRIITSKVMVPGVALAEDGRTKVRKAREAIISGFMRKNMFALSTSGWADDDATIPLVKAVKIYSKVDPSRATLKTCSVTWRTRTDYYEIPNATPINVTISPEEIKDINALYQVNQLTKVMSLINDILGNYKDDDIKTELDASFRTLPPTQKFHGTIDLAPREGYYSDHIQWRRDTFMDFLDTYVQEMIQVWNDPNVTVTVVGRAEIIRKITPTNFTYQSPSSIGPVDLDWVKTVCTSDKRTYTFMSSDKLRNNNNLIVILNPHNTDRIMYKLFDYQSYVSNEIRNAENPSLPAVHAFERYKFLSYQPVQTRIQVLNPTGMRNYVAPTGDGISAEASPYGNMNDFTANLPESVRHP